MKYNLVIYKWDDIGDGLSSSLMSLYGLVDSIK